MPAQKTNLNFVFGDFLLKTQKIIKIFKLLFSMFKWMNCDQVWIFQQLHFLLCSPGLNTRSSSRQERLQQRGSFLIQPRLQAPGPSAPLKLLHHRWPNYNHTSIPSTLPSCLVLPSSSPLNHMISYMTFQVVNNVNVEFGVRWYGMHYITRAAGKHPLIKSFESITSNTMQCAMWAWLPWRIADSVASTTRSGSLVYY